MAWRGGPCLLLLSGCAGAASDIQEVVRRLDRPVGQLACLHPTPDTMLARPPPTCPLLAPSTLRSPAPLPQVQRCTLLSIKTGGCSENCGYCSQSSHWSKDTGMKAEKLMDLEEVYQVCLACWAYSKNRTPVFD